MVEMSLLDPGQPGSVGSWARIGGELSHELVEGITDPGVGLNRVAWYDQNNGESADICAGAGSAAPVIGGDGVRYMVQRIWSNRADACIVSR